MTGKVAFAIGLAAFGLTGCNEASRRALTGPPQHDTQTVELDKAEMVRVEMRMGIDKSRRHRQSVDIQRAFRAAIQPSDLDNFAAAYTDIGI